MMVSSFITVTCRAFQSIAVVASLHGSPALPPIAVAHACSSIYVVASNSTHRLLTVASLVVKHNHVLAVKFQLVRTTPKIIFVFLLALMCAKIAYFTRIQFNEGFLHTKKRNVVTPFPLCSLYVIDAARQVWEGFFSTWDFRLCVLHQTRTLSRLQRMRYFTPLEGITNTKD